MTAATPGGRCRLPVCLLCRLLLMAIALAGCAHDPSRVPVVEHSESEAPGGYYTVHRGDTLYSIAWRFGREYRQLATANDIGPPYLIHPGQRIYVGPARKHHHIVTRGTAHASADATHSSAGDDRDGLPAVNHQAWRWPAAGPVTDHYSAWGKVHKGIDIRGKIGEAVRASKSGIVVYAGNGLSAYGLLIIVKHDQHYLSAYAFNRRALVKEGDRVKAGQKIAEMGLGKDKRPKLHFEIRRDGKPVNPLRLLPRR